MIKHSEAWASFLTKITGAALLVGLVVSSDAIGTVHDCSSTCTIITCDGTTCVVYRCSAGVCKEVGNYPDEQEKSLGGRYDELTLDPDDADGLNCYAQRCAVKTCDKLNCSVYGFDRGSVSVLAVLENTDAIADGVIAGFLMGRPSDN